MPADLRAVDFNAILMILNGIISLAPIVVSSTSAFVGGYTDWWTNVWAVVLGLQTHSALILERRRRDPLVLIVAFVMVAYFSLRIVTLSLYATSATLSRFLCTPQGINKSLIVIIMANFALYAGLMVVRQGTTMRTDTGSWRATSVGRCIALIGITIIAVYSPQAGALGSIPLFPIAVSFLSQGIVIPMTMAYCLLFRRTIPRLGIQIIFVLILGEAFLHFLAGSRSAIHALLINYLLVTLAINGGIKIPRKTMLIALALLPVLLPVAMESFSISTYIRANRESSQLKLKESVEISREYRLIAADADLEAKLIPMFDRIGFLDYSADLIINREAYSAAINPSAYIRSIIDNLLTPGFDVFDQPKIGNSIRAVYENREPIAKSELSLEYQSDQLGIYGELFVLFGYFSIPVFFILGFLANMLYFGVSSPDPFVRVIKRVIIVVTFLSLLNSFGLDWVLIDLVVLIIGTVVYERFIFHRSPSQIRSLRIDGQRRYLSTENIR